MQAPPGTEIAGLCQVPHYLYTSLHCGDILATFYCPLRNRKTLIDLKILLLQRTINEGIWRKFIDLRKFPIRWFRAISLDWQTEEKPENLLILSRYLHEAFILSRAIVLLHTQNTGKGGLFRFKTFSLVAGVQRARAAGTWWVEGKLGPNTALTWAVRVLSTSVVSTSQASLFFLDSVVVLP